MDFRQMKCNEDARVGVDVQYRDRSRSSISNAEPGRIRSPKIAFALAAKSGHTTGASLGRSGTMRPITRSLSRNSTVFPAFSQAFSRRVSLSSRILTLGMTIMCHMMCHIVNQSAEIGSASQARHAPREDVRKKVGSMRHCGDASRFFKIDLYSMPVLLKQIQKFAAAH